MAEKRKKNFKYCLCDKQEIFMVKQGEYRKQNREITGRAEKLDLLGCREKGAPNIEHKNCKLMVQEPRGE